jgi:hypothetical protein
MKAIRREVVSDAGTANPNFVTFRSLPELSSL